MFYSSGKCLEHLNMREEVLSLVPRVTRIESCRARSVKFLSSLSFNVHLFHLGTEFQNLLFRFLRNVTLKHIQFT